MNDLIERLRDVDPMAYLVFFGLVGLILYSFGAPNHQSFDANAEPRSDGMMFIGACMLGLALVFYAASVLGPELFPRWF